MKENSVSHIQEIIIYFNILNTYLTRSEATDFLKTIFGIT